MANKQKEFKGMPERTPLGKKAIEYLNAKEEMEKNKLTLDGIKVELVQAFIKAGKTSIKIEGHVVSYAHGEVDKVTVKQEA